MDLAVGVEVDFESVVVEGLLAHESLEWGFVGADRASEPLGYVVDQ